LSRASRGLTCTECQFSFPVGVRTPRSFNASAMSLSAHGKPRQLWALGLFFLVQAPPRRARRYQRRPICYSCPMAKPNPDSLAAQAQALSISARLLLFCVASRTGWERAGITRATVTTTVVRGLIDAGVFDAFSTMQ
jgi:hypothetical protein